MRKRRDMETFNLSFLDVVCCGFGAVILLLVITKIYEPITIQKSQEDLQALVSKLERELEIIRGDSTVLNQRLSSSTTQLAINKEKKNKLSGDLFDTEGQYDTTKAFAQIQSGERNALFMIKQSLTEVMKKLQKNQIFSEGKAVGIPVDSEYVIFVIDNSGSMQNNVWGKLKNSMADILAAYPKEKLKGIQVLNCNASYLYPSFKNGWIPDTPGNRNEILRRLNNWNAICDSDPTRGVSEAITRYTDNKKRIAIWIMGDDLANNLYDDPVEAIRRVALKFNKIDDNGIPFIRIHGMAFPNNATFYPVEFQNMLRVLASENYGAVVVESY